jgi:hypothetical protein
MGYFAGRENTTGCYNNFIGSLAGQCNTYGSCNNFIGYMAGRYSICGNNNNFFGYHAGRCNTSGSNNIFFGYAAGCCNTTGSNNILFGCGAGVGTAGLANITTQCNQIIMGNNEHTCARVKIAWTVTSDCRDKHIYCRLDKGRGFLQGINPIVFSFKNRETDEITDIKKRYGFVAQEILQLEGDDPVLVGADNPDKLGLTTDYLIPILVNAVKELSSELDTLKQNYTELRAEIDALKNS